MEVEAILSRVAYMLKEIVGGTLPRRDIGGEHGEDACAVGVDLIVDRAGGAWSKH